MRRVTTQAERNYPVDMEHTEQCFTSSCQRCRRSFVGYKRRRVCRACAAPTPPAIGTLVARAVEMMTGTQPRNTD